MGYVLELQFASPSEVILKGFMQQLKDLGLPSNLLEKSVSPHITLLSSETMPEEHTLENLEKLLRRQKEFSLSAVSLSTFANEQGVLFLGVVVNQALLELHHSVYTCLNQEMYNLNPYYLPSRWVPHITLATSYTREALGRAVEKLELTLPIELKVSRLALVKYPAPSERLKSWQLKLS